MFVRSFGSAAGAVGHEGAPASPHTALPVSSTLGGTFHLIPPPFSSRRREPARPRGQTITLANLLPCYGQTLEGRGGLPGRSRAALVHSDHGHSDRHRVKLSPLCRSSARAGHQEARGSWWLTGTGSSVSTGVLDRQRVEDRGPCLNPEALESGSIGAVVNEGASRHAPRAFGRRKEGSSTGRSSGPAAERAPLAGARGGGEVGSRPPRTNNSAAAAMRCLTASSRPQRVGRRMSSDETRPTGRLYR